MPPFGKDLEKEAAVGRVVGKRLRRLQIAPKHLRTAVEQAPDAYRATAGKGANRAWAGQKQMSSDSNGGIDSLIAYPFQLIAGKIFGKKKVHDTAWKYVNGPALRADTAAGGVLAKIPGIGKSLFHVKEKVHVGNGMYQEVTRPSALGPLNKSMAFAQPLILAHGVNQAMEGVKKMRSGTNDSQKKDSHLREKVASVMLHLQDVNREHEKRAHALKVLYKQAELGYVRMPQNYEEIEEKLASLVKEDLVVLEKALELAGGSEKLGELGSLDHKSSGRSPVEQFQAAILGEEN